MSQEITRLQELLKTFTPDQLSYIAVRPFVRYDYEAAKEAGLARETVSRWDNKADVDEAVSLMLFDGVMTAREILGRSLAKAAKEMTDELDHKSVAIRHKAATDILDRHLGKAGQKLDIELSNKEDETLQIGVKVIDYRHSIAALAPRPVPDSSTSSENESAINGETLGQDGAGRSADDDGLE